MNFTKTLLLVICLLGNLMAQYDYSPGFKAGKPVELNKLEFLKGDWEITEFWTAEKDSVNPAWKPMGKSSSTFEPIYSGTFILESSPGFPIIPVHEGFSAWEYTSFYSYDRFQKKYRCIVSDNILGLSDIYEGNFEGNDLILSNHTTSTFNNHGTNNNPQKNSIIISEITADSFILTWKMVDGNKIKKDMNYHDIPWRWSVKMVYRRKKENQNN